MNIAILQNRKVLKTHLLGTLFGMIVAVQCGLGQEACYPPNAIKCPVTPPACVEYKCSSSIAGWREDPSDRRKKVAVIAYSCPSGTQGSFDSVVSAQGSQTECLFESPSAEFGYEDVSSDLCWIVCYRIGHCATIGLRLDMVSGYESRRWENKAELQEEVGVTPVYEARCIPGFDTGKTEELLWLPCVGKYRECNKTTQTK